MSWKKEKGGEESSKPWAIAHPVHRAACNADGSGITELLAEKIHKASMNQVDKEGRAPLHYAAWNGLAVPVKLLCSAGAEVDVRSGDRGSTPLHFAAGMGHPECCKILIAFGASAGARDEQDGWTPEDLARQNLNRKSPEVVEAIVAALHGVRGKEAGAQPHDANEKSPG